jgi:hypothetical protein
VLPFAVGWGPWHGRRLRPDPAVPALLGGLFAWPLAVAGRRQRRALVRFWLAPAARLGWPCSPGASLLSFVVVRAAETLHASDEYVGLLLAGSTWPALAAFLIGRWLTHAGARAAASPPPAGPPPPRRPRS